MEGRTCIFYWSLNAVVTYQDGGWQNLRFAAFAMGSCLRVLWTKKRSDVTQRWVGEYAMRCYSEGGSGDYHRKQLAKSNHHKHMRSFVGLCVYSLEHPGGGQPREDSYRSETTIPSFQTHRTLQVFLPFLNGTTSSPSPLMLSTTTSSLFSTMIFSVVGSTP